MQRDLYLIRGAAWNAAIWALNSIGAILLLWATSIEATTAQGGSDYLWPAQAKGGFITVPVSTESSRPSAGKSPTTTYQTFDGASYQLVENRGRYVNVLLPQSFNDGTILFPQLLQPVGGHFGRSYDPESVSQRDWGELTLELDCSGGIASYKSKSAGYSNGSQSLLPLTQLVGSACSD
jgi:hypothetical protein